MDKSLGPRERAALVGRACVVPVSLRCVGTAGVHLWEGSPDEYLWSAGDYD